MKARVNEKLEELESREAMKVLCRGEWKPCLGFRVGRQRLRCALRLRTRTQVVPQCGSRKATGCPGGTDGG